MKADLIKRLRTHASGHLPLGWTDERMLLEEAAAALEAEASEGERRGLERAAEVADAIEDTYSVSAMQEDLEDWEVFQRREGERVALRIAAAIRALPEAPAQGNPAPASTGEWMPIETAPKNGSEFLAWDGFHVFVCMWNGGIEDGKAFGAWCASANLSQRPWTSQWRPLPPPPPQDHREG